MGVVYKARDPIINRLVALKKIKANVADSPALLERFYREAQSAGSLQHPNIVTIYEMGEEDGVPFIAMQLVDGQNLGNLIAQRVPIPLSLKLVYAVEACRAFAYAHKQGIVHRDIKPGNVMVSKEGAVKVVDFGIARVLENSKTQTGMLIGTFAYMPPEVFNGEHADERSDIFSFGVLLYELLAYTRPFPGDIPASLMQSICLKEPIPLREVAPGLPARTRSSRAPHAREIGDGAYAIDGRSFTGTGSHLQELASANFGRLSRQSQDPRPGMRIYSRPRAAFTGPPN